MGKDLRSDTQKALDATFGMPLYYCSECLRAIKVTPVEGKDPVIKRPCTDCKDAQIFAPRKAIATGKGAISTKTRTKIAFMKLMALLTQRSAV